MGKSTHFIGQPIFCQVMNLLDRSEIIEISRELGGESYVKSFNAWVHLVTMLYATFERFDSLREISLSMQAEARKLRHLGITTLPSRSTLADANRRRPDAVFEAIYRLLYNTYCHELSSDSRTRDGAKWMKRLKIMDSTTVSLFKNTVYKGAGRNPKRGRKKGGVKVHADVNAAEGVPYDVKFTSAATHDSFMLRPETLSKDDIIAIDRAYIDYEKFEELSKRGVTYVTKMKKNLTYRLLDSMIYQTPDGLTEVLIKRVAFSKEVSDGNGGKETLTHNARIISYADARNQKLISLLTNDMEADPVEIIEIYRKRWEIELLFKQIKQNFPLRYFYGESANAIKIQIWVILIANLLLTVLQKRLERRWSFSGLATMVRIVLMYYVDFYSLFNHPEKDWEATLKEVADEPPVPDPELPLTY